MFISGNYAGEFFKTVKDCVIISSADKYNQAVENFSEFKENNKVLMVIDVDNFSEFCKELNNESLWKYITNYFEIISSCITEDLEGTVLKFIGDAIFATIQYSENLIDIAKGIRRKYLCDIESLANKISIPIPDIAIVIREGSFIEGLICCASGYLDYSIWGPKVNSLFKIIKIEKKPGIFVCNSIYNKLQLKNNKDFKPVNDDFYYREF